MNVNDCGKVCVAAVIASCGTPNPKAAQDCIVQCMQYSHFPNLNPIEVGKDLAQALLNKYTCKKYTDQIAPVPAKEFSRDIAWEPIVVIGLFILIGLVAPEVPATAGLLKFAF